VSEDSFTEVTHESWVSRVGGALKAVLFGLVLFVIAFPLLFWNEGRAVKRYKTLSEGGGVVVSVTSDNVDTANEGKLIHVTGKADTDAILSDPVFGVSANALKLKRTVEMYQWKETSQSKTKKTIGGGTETVRTYTYGKTWTDKPISSTGFKEAANHRNPPSIPYESTQQIAHGATLGAYNLSSSLVDKIDSLEPLPVGSDTPLPASLKNKANVFDGKFHFGADPASPQVGDIRVKFQFVRPTEVSIIAKQAGSTFEPYRTEAGGEIELLQTGTHSAGAMIQDAQESNKILTWILRLVGLMAIWIGLSMILRPLSVVADVLPILGDIVGAGTGIISFLLASILSLLTISIAWVVYRPVLGVLLMAVSAGLIMGVMAKLKSAKKRHNDKEPERALPSSEPGAARSH
jgi:hypothetical protein